MIDAFDAYARMPRDPNLAHNLYASLRKAWLGVGGTVLGSLVFGVILSFARGRHSRPWEPLDMLLGGFAVAIFAVPIALVFVWMFRRYVKLYETGRLVEGVVVEIRPNGAILQIDVSGPNLTFVPWLRAQVGDRYAVIVGDAMSSLALIATFTAHLERGSLLTAAQVAAMPRG
jgi:ABC-type Fe3+-siderophore transport system permease subunit